MLFKRESFHTKSVNLHQPFFNLVLFLSTDANDKDKINFYCHANEMSNCNMLISLFKLQDILN